MKRFFTSYWSIPVVFVVIPVFGFLFFLLNAYLFRERSYPGYYRGQCQSNLKQIAFGLIMYSQDYDEKLPPIIFSGETVGWAEGLQPYLKSRQIFQCPIEQHERQDDPRLPGFTDYWMNQNVASVKLLDFNDEVQTILFGEGDGGSSASTASYAINRLPKSWLELPDSPATRHLGGANYAFVDSHVKWLKPDEIANATTSLNPDVSTFSIR